jgi:hypothetical protein
MDKKQERTSGLLLFSTFFENIFSKQIFPQLFVKKAASG